MQKQTVQFMNLVFFNSIMPIFKKDYRYRFDHLEEEEKEVKQGGRKTLDGDADIIRDSTKQTWKQLNGVRKGTPTGKGKLPQRSMTSPNFKTRHPRARTSSEKAEENDMVSVFKTFILLAFLATIHLCFYSKLQKRK